jgi:hypothetical protein
VLDKIELLVGGGGPEILPVVTQILFFLFAPAVGDGDAAFFAEGRIG